MIEKFADIPFGESNKAEDMDNLLQKHLGIGFAQCAEALSASLKERADELLEDLIYIAPYGKFETIIEDKEKILQFLQEEAIKPENWKFQFIEVKKEKDTLMELVFFNDAVDDGDILKGFVFLGFSGNIRHCFTQVHS
jgi:hypothetical protein